jgi:glycosyltransferase involved in cell wall biosynthesis
MTARREQRLAVVLKGYPRLSETFIAQEILGLEARGIALDLYSLRHPTDPSVHPVHREIKAAVTYLPEYVRDAPGRVLAGWQRARRLPGFAAARRRFLKDLLRDPTPNRLRRFAQACVLAAELPPATARIYAHFLHTPSSVARYAAIMRGLPWCASAHAKDIWTTPAWEIREKLLSADWVVTCTASGHRQLAGLAPEPRRVALLYHGLDFRRFPFPGARGPGPDGRDPDRPVELLSVGRMVEKKGYDGLLRALAGLPADRNWRFCHIGGGALEKGLRALADELGLTSRITWLGARPQEEVLARYRQADLFVLASRIAADGDRDGLPNVLMEAQSQGLACLSTDISAIPELIEDGKTGVLVPAGDIDALNRALARLIAAPKLRATLGNAGAVKVRRDFSMEAGIDELAGRLAQAQADTLSPRDEAARLSRAGT